MYAITPRFAPTSTPISSKSAGALWSEHPDCYMQTHVSENKGEVAWVKELFPDRKGYLDVYDHHKLCRPRAVFGHGIHLDRRRDAVHAPDRLGDLALPDVELLPGQRLSSTSHRAMQKERPVRVGLGTDLGAGTSFSILADAERGLQGGAAQQQRADRRPRLLSRDARHGERHVSSTTRSAASRPAWRPTSSCST